MFDLLKRNYSLHLCVWYSIENVIEWCASNYCSQYIIYILRYWLTHHILAVFLRLHKSIIRRKFPSSSKRRMFCRVFWTINSCSSSITFLNFGIKEAVDSVSCSLQKINVKCTQWLWWKLLLNLLPLSEEREFRLQLFSWGQNAFPIKRLKC